MAYLYEFGKWTNVSEIVSLKELVKKIWNERLFVQEKTELTEEESDVRYQPFLKFDGNQVKANDFIGFIQNGEEVIEIYPKVFRDILPAPNESDKHLMLQHIFYWFSYCRKWKFPFNKASLNNRDIVEFPELIINLIANQFLETISRQPLMIYQPVEEALFTPRGTINFTRYINRSLANGNLHSIECDHEPFLFNNKVNQIIKYCARLLLNQSKFQESKRALEEAIFILEEVDDLYCSMNDFSKIKLNSFFTDYLDILDSCKLVMSNQLYSNNTNELFQWSLLFPMEYIFEDFLAGFLEDKFSQNWKVEYQKSDLYLSNRPEVFNMQHDIFLSSKNGSKRKIIIDTKYKIRTKDFKSDNKKGVVQSDLYQMVSYAFKRGCTDVIVVYPNLGDELHSPDVFEILSGFEGKEKINVIAIEIPFWSIRDFELLEERLLTTINKLLNNIEAN